MKRAYGSRNRLLGNADLNLLGMGTPEQVEEEARSMIRDSGPGGGYIPSSGNSLAHSCRMESILAMTRAVQQPGQYPAVSIGHVGWR